MPHDIWTHSDFISIHFDTRVIKFVDTKLMQKSSKPIIPLLERTNSVDRMNKSTTLHIFKEHNNPSTEFPKIIFFL